MKITVKLLATYRKKLPRHTQGSSCELEIDAASTVEELMESFGIACDKSNVILVNGHVPDVNQILEEGDQVCAFPAMAGGCQNIKI
ncbi:MoaD/ThiS family protein [Chloroflexota bacterium]